MDNFQKSKFSKISLQVTDELNVFCTLRNLEKLGKEKRGTLNCRMLCIFKRAICASRPSIVIYLHFNKLPSPIPEHEVLIMDDANLVE